MSCSVAATHGLVLLFGLMAVGCRALDLDAGSEAIAVSPSSSDVLLSLIAARDVEPLPSGPFSFGAKSISGGAGEGDQQLADDGPWQQRQEVKSDGANNVLPAYCEPPNPCPLGYHTTDGCLEEFENTADFSRRFQSTQHCVCDTEHMFNCAAKADQSDEQQAEEDEQQTVVANENDDQDDVSEAEDEETAATPEARAALEALMAENDQLHQAAIAKKFHEKRSVDTLEPRRRKRSVGVNMRKRAASSHQRVNPYLVGTPINSVQKKSGRNMW